MRFMDMGGKQISVHVNEVFAKKPKKTEITGD
jgi:hypothetical protein